MVTSAFGEDGLRDCLAEPIPEIFEAANLLNYAVSAHLRHDNARADVLLRAADMPIIGKWLDSIWLGTSRHRVEACSATMPPIVAKADRYNPRNATSQMQRALVARDGHHCRLCGIPLVRAAVRKLLTTHYPVAARWTGRKEADQHRGLQAMWLQYDHVIVHSRGGETTLDNLVITCPACNFGRNSFMMPEVGLRDPRTHIRLPAWEGRHSWDGLERVLPEKKRYLQKSRTTRQSLPA